MVLRRKYQSPIAANIHASLLKGGSIHDPHCGMQLEMEKELHRKS